MTHQLARKCAVAAIGIAAFTVSPAKANEGRSSKRFGDMSIEELLNVKMNVASKAGATSRTSPGIVSLITADEIAASGARDLMDVLLMVPGFFPAADVQGVTSFGLRGLWGHEGKILFMVDGQEMNETMYATYQLGNELPVAFIDRVEIIRGPGSAVYGGFAELGVVNVITKGAASLNGGAAYVTAGRMSHGYARQGVGLAYGKKLANDLSVSILAATGKGQRSDRDFADSVGSTYNLRSNSQLDPQMINASVAYKDAELRVIANNYHVSTRDTYDVLAQRPLDNDFKTLAVSGKYTHKVNSVISVSPELSYHSMVPWQNLKYDSNLGATGGIYDKIARRMEGKIAAIAEVHPDYKIIGGVGIALDHARDRTPGSVFAPTGMDTIKYVSKHVYAELQGDLKFAQLTAGARYDLHNQFGDAFSPRLGLVKTFGSQAHAKLLYSRAFRAPSIENINLNAAIRPEKTGVVELEGGYGLTEKVYLTANLFDIRIDNPIVYTSVGGADAYYNFPKIGSRGLEVESKYKSGWGSFTANYSFYAVANNQVPIYQLPNRPHSLLGFPAHKAAVASSIRVLGEGLRLNPSAVFFSSRDAYTYVDDGTGTSVGMPTRARALWLLNANVSYDNFLTRGLDMAVGVRNLGDADFRMVQPYDGFHNPLPASSREVFFQAFYRQEI